MKTQRRPSRDELAERFFPEVVQARNSDDVRDAVNLNTRACEVILLDMLKRHDEGFDNAGPGVLVLHIGEDIGGYVTAEGFEADKQTARDAQDTEMEAFFEKILSRIEANADRSKVLILLIDKSSQRLMELSRDFPASEIEAMQYALAAGLKGRRKNNHGLLLPSKPQGFGKEKQS